ncbi:hypothetical protein A0H81_00134 [Grifola frondosa]|uniref:Uncharacterized protein n=1 Tax=Grifola frondosa TaxID=5627 RepID=A0A1C7MRR5_GRIFR|nr:hypothetical protein A0H81_00134 [Grifola frondosa]
MRDIPNNITSSSGRGHFSVGMALSDSSLLRNEVAVEAAIRGLESYLGKETNVEHLINDLLSIPHLFEFVMSAVANETFLALKAWIIQHFPAKPEDFATSIVSVLLSRLSLSLVFLPYSSSAEEPGRLKECRRSVELALAVLQAIPSLVFADEVEVVDDDLDEFQSAFLPFDNMQVSIPSTKEEADGISVKDPRRSGDILQYYLEIFRYPQLTTTFKKAYLPQELSFYDASTIEEDDNVEANTSLANDDIPAAYPMVQPMKAALYFDSADGFGEWRILISTRADRDLRQARKKDAKIFRIIIKKIRELSKGHFSDDNQKRLTGLEVEVPIYEAKMTRDSRLVYQVDCIPEFESDVERQVLRIFGIYTHAQLDHRFWDCMGQQLGRKGKEYRQRCVFRNKPVNAGDNVIMPASFPPPSDDMVLSPSGIPDLRKEDLEELHSLLVLEKFVTFSQALLNSILADQDVAHVFDVSPQEKKIIEHTSSCYVLGRSGTGKTTTMLFKMLGIERSWEAYRDAMPKPRQLFVTQSRVLAEKVEEYFAKLIESLATANQSPKELINIAATKKNQQEQGLVDRDEEIYWRGDLPKRYSELKDEHFPCLSPSIISADCWKPR